MYTQLFLLALLPPLALCAPTALSSTDLDFLYNEIPNNRRHMSGIPTRDLDPVEAIDDLFSSRRDADKAEMNLVRKSWESESFDAKEENANSGKSVAAGSLKRAVEPPVDELAGKVRDGTSKSVVGTVKRAVETTAEELAAVMHDKMTRWFAMCEEEGHSWMCGE